MRATPFGMICFTGPTGSGKSTSLRHSLQLLKRERPGANVITIEDPPEGVIMGARQIPIVDATSQTERAGRFHETITASLRLAPNVIYIGEIRDDQSAKLAFEAAMTGHQVWTTLHVTNAMMIPARLRDLGVEDYKLYGSDVLTGLIAQRLVRRLCPECKVPIDEAIFRGSAETAVDTDLALRLDDILGDFAGIFVANRRGCSACDHGYAGRTVIAEIIVPDVEFMKLLRRSLFDDAEQHWRSEMGGMTLYEDAFRKMRLGLIDPTDIEMWFGRLRSPPRVARAPAAATRTTGLAEDRA
jgi:type II secretory ATPase GspE/PulE/Tfp pilus assembly ATPase PilB-like protein